MPVSIANGLRNLDIANSIYLWQFSSSYGRFNLLLQPSMDERTGLPKQFHLAAKETHGLLYSRDLGPVDDNTFLDRGTLYTSYSHIHARNISFMA